LPNPFYAEIEGHLESGNEAHPELLAALRTGRAGKARTVMESHVLEGADRLIESLGQSAFIEEDGAESAS
jgi:DNA-binding FadR family transcriptional regulator